MPPTSSSRFAARAPKDPCDEDNRPDRTHELGVHGRTINEASVPRRRRPSRSTPNRTPRACFRPRASARLTSGARRGGGEAPVPAFRPVVSSPPPSDPDVRVPPHPALHEHTEWFRFMPAPVRVPQIVEFALGIVGCPLV